MASHSVLDSAETAEVRIYALGDRQAGYCWLEWTRFTIPHRWHKKERQNEIPITAKIIQLFYHFSPERLDSFPIVTMQKCFPIVQVLFDYPVPHHIFKRNAWLANDVGHPGAEPVNTLLPCSLVMKRFLRSIPE